MHPPPVDSSCSSSAQSHRDGQRSVASPTRVVAEEVVGDRPVGVTPDAPVTVEVSYAAAPVCSVPAHVLWVAASSTAELIVTLPLATAKGSQGGRARSGVVAVTAVGRHIAVCAHREWTRRA